MFSMQMSTLNINQSICMEIYKNKITTRFIDDKGSYLLFCKTFCFTFSWYQNDNRHNVNRFVISTYLVACFLMLMIDAGLSHANPQK